MENSASSSHHLLLNNEAGSAHHHLLLETSGSAAHHLETEAASSEHHHLLSEEEAGAHSKELTAEHAPMHPASFQLLAQEQAQAQEHLQRERGHNSNASHLLKAETQKSHEALVSAEHRSASEHLLTGRYATQQHQQLLLENERKAQDALLLQAAKPDPQGSAAIIKRDQKNQHSTDPEPFGQQDPETSIQPPPPDTDTGVKP